MGSAGGDISQDAMERSYLLGRAIAERDCVVVTGGCPGLPHAATKGAKEAGGFTVGISPGIDLREHVELYKSPTEYLDILIFTGSGLMGREVIGVRSCDMIIIVGGRSGTLGEFSIAYDEGKPIGVLEGTGGITSFLNEIVRVIQKETGSQIIYDSDPDSLLDRLIEVYEKTKGNPRRYDATG
ncbi:hypothetical protein FJZ33_11670 [Candidatus Poribacteria bacterium]|nr:hypothetical protein [Candidatus Poribacteria bacterium]